MTTAPSGQDLAALKGRTLPVQDILDLFQVESATIGRCSASRRHSRTPG
jgi:hypothetical protein